MADLQHVEILKKGAKAWNAWRDQNPDSRPDLTDADFHETKLAGANFSHALLNSATFNRADLRDADFRFAHLPFVSLVDVNLSGAVFRRAFAVSSMFNGSRLMDVDFEETELSYVDFSKANLGGAKLIGASLVGAVFFETILQGADFLKCVVAGTSFGYTDLSEVKNLETVMHLGASSIGVDTIYKSHGKIPESFLRGCGMPESFIAHIPTLISALEPIEFYSCFISYSSGDQDFVERLLANFRAKSVPVWYAPQDLPIGAKIRPAIDESIRLHDKLLLILSEHSVSSQWVEQEVETALAREREQEGKTVLFPIRVDDAIMEIKSGWPALLKNTRNVGDFTRWKEHDSYQKAFDRLLRDLRAEEKKA